MLFFPIKHKLLKDFVTLSVATWFLGLGAWAQTADEAVAEPRPVSVVTARYQDSYASNRFFSGRLGAAESSELAFQVTGEVSTILVEAGDRVERGQVLASLDPRRFEIRLAEAEAAVLEAEAENTLVEDNFARVEKLRADQFASEQDLDTALAARDASRQRIEARRRTAETARQDLSDTRLRAPFSGVVVARFADRGETLAAGTRVLRLNETATLDAHIGVPAPIARRLTIDAAHPLRINDAVVEGRITGISDDVDTATRSVLVRFAIDPAQDEATGIFPGDLVQLRLSELRRGRGAWLPSTALSESYRGLWSVFVVNQEDSQDVVRRRDVEIVSIGDESVFVTGTLEEGDRVIASAPFRFVPGQRVDVVERLPAADVVTSLVSGRRD